MDAYVHVKKAGSRVAVGVVIREGYETLSSAGWLHEDDDVWQALRETVEGLCERNVPMTIYTPERAAELATSARQPKEKWRDVVHALRRAGCCVRWCGHVAMNTGMVDARAKALLQLGQEPRGSMSWRSGRCR